MGKDVIVWRILSAMVRSVSAKAPLAKAVIKWAADNRKALKLGKNKPLDWPMLAEAAAARASSAEEGALFAMVDRVAQALRLDGVDAGLLWFVIAADRVEGARAICTAGGARGRTGNAGRQHARG